MRRAFRSDLVLAPGETFHLRRRPSARICSAALALAALGFGVYDLVAGLWLVGAATLVIALAFVAQLVRAELEVWRFEGEALRSHGFRIDARKIRGIRVGESEEGHARAWVETRDGEQLPLVEGDEREVEVIADRLSRALLLASKQPPDRWLN